MLVNFITRNYCNILENKYMFFILPFWRLFLIIHSMPKFDRHSIQVWTDYLTNKLNSTYLHCNDMYKETERYLSYYYKEIILSDFQSNL